jgi:subtilase family serine protease
MARRAVLIGVVLVLGLSMGAALLGAGNLAELSIREIILDPPSLVTRGTQLNVVVHVANTGYRTAERFETGLYVRPQQQGAPWTRLPGAIETPYLSPAEGREIELAFAVETMDWQPGTYEIRAVIDIGNAIQELDEFNNEFIVVMTLVESAAGLPDLQPVEIDFTPTDPNDETAPWTVAVTVTNTGDETAGPFRITLLRNGLAFATIPQFGLPKSGEVVVAGTLCGNEAALAGDVSGYLGCSGGLPSGVYEIRALVDTAEEVAEKDEHNNTLIGTMSVQALELRPKSLTFDRSPIRLNEDVTLTATVVNTGRGSAEAVQVAFFVNGKQLDIQSVGPIGYQSEVKAETVLNAARLGFFDAPESYEVHVVVDPHDLLHETDEDNNTLVRSMSILAPLAALPELMPRSLGLYPASPVELGRANELTVTSTVLNSGRSAATDFDVRFFFRSKGASRWIPFPCVDETQCSAATLGAGASVPFVGSLTTIGFSPGVYELRVAVDPADRITELDERNNELIAAVTLQAAQLPDLTACGQLVADPSSAVRRGRTVTLSLCVTNEGDTASGPFNVRFTHCLAPEVAAGQSGISPCDGPGGYSAVGLYPSIVAAPPLEPGESIYVATRLETEELNPGAYFVNVEIDADASSPLGLIGESNELNNLVQSAVFVVGPDLALVDLQMSPPSPVAQGQIVEAAAIVSNLGEEAAGQFNVSYYVLPAQQDGIPTTGCAGGTDCSSALVSRVLVPGLAVDGFERIVCNLDTAALVPGPYVLRAVAELVDVVGKVPEHSVLNNVIEIPFVVVEGGPGGPSGPADLAVQQVLVSPNIVSAGESGAAWVLVSNVGTEVVGPFDVAFVFTDSHGGTMALATHFAGTIEPGETDVRINVQFPTASLSTGTVTLIATVDPANLLPETNRGNNAGTRTFRIR